MIRSDLKVADTRLGDQYWLCRAWLDPNADFVPVEVIRADVRRVRVRGLGDGAASEEASVFASSLWSDSQLEYARECRDKDLEIRELDLERPVDHVTRLAIETCCELVSGDCDVENAAVTRGLLRRLGRQGDLSELHPLAYAEDSREWSRVNAPQESWRQLYSDFAAAEPQLIDERAAGSIAALSYESEVARSQALAMIRRWAGLPVIEWSAGADEPDEVTRLRGIIELAAVALDEAGRADQALSVRKAAFPHRFSARVESSTA